MLGGGFDDITIFHAGSAVALITHLYGFVLASFFLIARMRVKKLAVINPEYIMPLMAPYRITFFATIVAIVSMVCLLIIVNVFSDMLFKENTEKDKTISIKDTYDDEGEDVDEYDYIEPAPTYTAMPDKPKFNPKYLRKIKLSDNPTEDQVRDYIDDLLVVSKDFSNMGQDDKPIVFC
ncbi:MAG: hypothetical protein ACYTFY_12450 [Planctomycetota bacterium]|jgi:hypothetical protein